MSSEKNMVILFTDGSMVAFNFEKQIKDPIHLVKSLDNALNQPFISIEADGMLHLYPRENIKSIQLYPCPAKLPDYTIKGATVC